ncbi:hypothetical protein LXA34_17905, partial [Erwinia amylovora]
MLAGIATSNVLDEPNGFQVIGVAAPTNPTEMIENKPVWDRTDHRFVRKTVGRRLPSRPIQHGADANLPIPVRPG